MNVTSFVSFDVEALPGRARDDHVQRLIWGKFQREEHGIRRICQILNEYKIKGNFLIDLSACALYGDGAVQEVGDYLLEQGHELHAHLHSEWLLRQWGVKGNYQGPAGLDQLDLPTNQILLRHTHRKFHHLFGHEPQVFRGGGYHFNEFTIAAAQAAGFKCLSNFNAQRHAHRVTLDDDSRENEAFAWENGLLELPVDFSPEPLSFPKEHYLGQFGRVLRRKKNKTFNLTLHSWSLLRREGNHFTGPAVAHEERLREILEHLLQHTTPMGYSDFLTRLAPTALAQPSATFTTTTALSHFDPNLVCNICATILQTVTTATCPGCSSTPRQRQIRSALESMNNPFDHQRVLATSADPLEKAVLFSACAEVLHVDWCPAQETALHEGAQAIASIPDSSVDGFIALHALNHAMDEKAALGEIHRVLRPDGRALLTTAPPTGKGGPDDGAAEAQRWLSTLFECTTVNGKDPFTGQTRDVFFLRKRAPLGLEPVS